MVDALHYQNYLSNNIELFLLTDDTIYIIGNYLVQVF